MSLIVEFTKAIERPENWYLQNGMATPNWNFIDADCYMACGNDYPNADAFYDDWNTLCDIYVQSLNSDSLRMARQLEVDKHAA
jgi:hypothetical protein